MSNTATDFNLLSGMKRIEIAMKFVVDKALEKGIITQRGVDLYNSHQSQDKDYIEVAKFMESKQFEKEYTAYYNERVNKDSGIDNAMITIKTTDNKCKTYILDSIEGSNQVERIAKNLMKQTPKCKATYIRLFNKQKLKFYIEINKGYGKARKKEYFK